MRTLHVDHFILLQIIIKKTVIAPKAKIIMRKMLMFMSLFATLCYTSCAPKHEEKEEETKFLVTSPLRKDTLSTRQYVCQIRSIQHIELRALERGYLQKIFVDEGQHVRQGQRMFQIMPLLYQAEQQKAQAEADFAEIEYQNTKQLADSNVVSPNELKMAKAKFARAKAELSLAQTHLLFTEIKAPFDGIMDRFQARLGSLVDEGDLLTTLSDNRKVWVYFNVPEAEYLDYKSKAKKDSVMNVELIMANHKMFDHPGIVETIEADFDNETGNISFRATFPNPKGLLRHGETGNIQVKRPVKNALLIPQKATFEVLEKKYVYVVDKDNIVRSREITIGAELPHIFIVESGLKENDRILLEGLRQVRENEKIECKFVRPDSVISHLELYAE
jgi:membrane fusion protein, multidrug efflux system